VILPLPALSQSGRPLRARRLPARYQDVIPEPPQPATSSELLIPAAPSSETASLSSQATVLPRVTLIVQNPYCTPPNNFGIWKEYLYRPSYDPDAFVSAEDLYRPHISTIMAKQVEEEQSEASASPYTNKSTALLIDWQSSGSSAKSNNEVNHLIHDIILHPDFQLDQLCSFNMAWENQKADLADAKSPLLQAFQHMAIQISIPSGNKDTSPRAFSIPGLYYRKLTTLIKEAFESPLSSMFHLTPFKMYRARPDGNGNERIFSEMYDSDLLWEEHNKVQHAPTDDLTCKREKVVAALMFWSDATHLATFGTAKLWPIYLLFGNLSKYVCCQPDSSATKHLAYIPSLPDSLQDELKCFHEKWETQQKDILTHCRRELMHGVWTFLLDEDFQHAYKFGIVVQCQDRIERRIYPRIVTYSADYPEKCVLFSLQLVPLLTALIG
jgi:hypothetical protein